MTPPKDRECVCSEINSRNCPVHQNDREVQRPREWWIRISRTGENTFGQGTVHSSRPEISDYSMAVKVVEAAAYEKAVNGLKGCACNCELTRRTGAGDCIRCETLKELGEESV